MCVRCCTGDEGRPLGTGLQEQVSNHLKLRRLRAGVVSVKEKARGILRQVRIKETNASKPLMKCRKRMNGVKTGRSSLAQDKSEGRPVYCSGGVRHEGGVNLISGSCVERGNLSPRCEGRNSSGGPTRVRVPMRGTGAEQPVVAVKSMKVDGAKGLYDLVLFYGQLVRGGTGE